MTSLPNLSIRAAFFFVAKRLSFVVVVTVVVLTLFFPSTYSRASNTAAPDPKVPQFTDIAPQYGFNEVSAGYGLNPVDFNQDGLLDITFPNHVTSPLSEFQQMSPGVFQDVGFAIGIAQQNVGGYQPDKHGNAWGACTNSGHLDLYQALGAQESDLLFVNNGDNTFTQAAAQHGISDADRGRGASWVDYDNDGLLDIYVTNAYLAGSHDRLYHNAGNCNFVDVSATAGDITSRFHRIGASWADYDNSGWMSVYAASGTKLISDTLGLDANSHLYHNNHDGTFTDVTTTAGLNVEAAGGMAWGDYLNNGCIDLFVAGVPAGGGTTVNRLYRNNCDGTFTEVAAQAGVATSGTFNSQDAVWGDFNNDGYLDLYVVNAGDGVTGGQPNFLYLNNGDGTFTEVGAQAGQAQGALDVSGSVASGDLFNDGNLDLFVNKGLGTDSAVSGAPHQVLRNLGNGDNNTWLELWLKGTQSNYLGIGARVEVITDTGLTLYRQQNGGYHQFSQDSLVLHFGLGQSQHVTQIIINWPSGITQTLSNVAVDQLLTVVEASGGSSTSTPSSTASPAVTSSSTPTRSPTPTITAVASATSSRTATTTRTPSATPNRTPTATPVASATPSPQATVVNSGTPTESGSKIFLPMVSDDSTFGTSGGW
jgi:hypothetical protein